MRLAEFQAEFPGLCVRLRQVRLHRRWAHAYLFTGDDPAFLERFALAWAQTCACSTPLPDGDACEDCPACRAFAGRAYTEFFLIQPESKSRQIVVGDLDKVRPRGIRHFIHEIGFTADRGVLKVGVILEADRMNDQAQNAFLKTLEEPPRDTLLLLTSANPKKLLPTIRSRCQAVPLLRNRCGYETAREHGLFPILAGLQPQAGAAAAIRGAYGILRIFDALRQESEAEAEAAGIDHALEELAAADKSVRKELEDQQKVAASAAFLRRRQEITDAIYVWFQQQFLLAAGTPPADLPHPEFFTAAGVVPGASPAGPAETACRLTADLLRHLDGNVEERLAVEGWALSLCSRPAVRRAHDTKK